MRADTFEIFILVDDKDFGAASCIAFAVAYSEREKRWQNSCSFECMKRYMPRQYNRRDDLLKFCVISNAGGEMSLISIPKDTYGNLE